MHRIIYIYVFLLVWVCLCPGIQAQNWAGMDQVICQGQGATLGIPGSPEDWCYTWSPSIGFGSASIHDKQPTVHPPSTTDYTVVAISPDFSQRVTDQVKITVSLGGVKLTPEHTNPDSAANQASASLTAKPPGVTIKWTIEGADHGCEINETTGKISYCYQYGEVIVRAAVVGNEDCYAEGTFFVDADVMELIAYDNAHQTRFVKNGDTLHLVGHNDVKFVAVPYPGESFTGNQPDWSGSTVSPPQPNAVEWIHDSGAPLFMTIKAGTKTVYVERDDAGEVGLGGLQNGLITLLTALKEKIKPSEALTKGFTGDYENSTTCTPLEIAAEFLNFNYKQEPVEKFNSPDRGYKYTFEMENQAQITGKLCAPPPYSSPPNPFFIYNVFVQGTGAVKVNAALSKDESMENPNWEVSTLDLTGEIKLGVGGALGLLLPGDIWGLQGGVFGGTVIGFDPTFALPKNIMMKIKVEPLIIEGNLQVFWLNPNNLVVDLKGKYNLLDPIELEEYPIIQLTK